MILLPIKEVFDINRPLNNKPMAENDCARVKIILCSAALENMEAYDSVCVRGSVISLKAVTLNDVYAASNKIQSSRNDIFIPFPDSVEYTNSDSLKSVRELLKELIKTDGMLSTTTKIPPDAEVLALDMKLMMSSWQVSNTIIDNRL